MHKTSTDQTQKCQKHYKMEFSNIGKAFQMLGSALQQDGNYLNPNLTNAITCTGEAYEEIGKMYEDQPRNDWEHLGDMMHDYRGLLSGWPGILQIHAVRNFTLFPTFFSFFFYVTDIFFSGSREQKERI